MEVDAHASEEQAPSASVGGWQCSLSVNMRHLARVLGTFDKIGRDLYIEALPDRLLLRTLNTAQSAFCLCTLPAGMFDEFCVDENPPNVKIWLKNVERTLLQLINHGASSYLRVKLKCLNGLEKTFDLSYEEIVPVNAMYDADACPHRICTDPRLLLDCVQNLPTGLHELMLVVSPGKLVVRNDVDDNQRDNAVQTEMTVAPGDLQEFHLGALASNPLRIGFGTREFKAMLSFAETTQTSIVLHFDVGGQPVILVAEVGDGMPHERARVECVIASVVDQAAAAAAIFGDDDLGFAPGFDGTGAGENVDAPMPEAGAGRPAGHGGAAGPAEGAAPPPRPPPSNMDWYGGSLPSGAHAGDPYGSQQIGTAPRTSSGPAADRAPSSNPSQPRAPSLDAGGPPGGGGSVRPSHDRIGLDSVETVTPTDDGAHARARAAAAPPAGMAHAMGGGHAAMDAHAHGRAPSAVGDQAPMAPHMAPALPASHAAAPLPGAELGPPTHGTAATADAARGPSQPHTPPDTDDDEDAVGGTPPDSPSKRLCVEGGFAQQFASRMPHASAATAAAAATHGSDGANPSMLAPR